MIKKLVLILGPIAVLALAFVVYLGLQATKPEPEKSIVEERPLSLFVDNVALEDITLPVYTQGEVRPRTEIELASQVGGRIVEVSENFVPGGPVTAGHTLIKIEDADYRLAVTRAEYRVAEAATQVELKRASAEIARRNWDDSVVGKPTALALKMPQLDEARAKLRAAEADLEAARLNLERTNIMVPFNGRIRTKSADIGQFVNAGQSLGRVYSTEIVEVRLPLTDDQLAALGLPIAFAESDGNGPAVSLSAVVAGEQRRWQGRIVRTDAAMDVETRVLYAVAQVDAPYDEGADHGMPLAIGLYVDARIEGRLLRGALVLPRAALRGENKVFVIKADDTLDIRAVTVLFSDRDRIVLAARGNTGLRAGVRAGDQVVVSPVKTPRQGMKVVPIRRLAATPSAAIEPTN